MEPLTLYWLRNTGNGTRHPGSVNATLPAELQTGP